MITWVMVEVTKFAGSDLSFETLFSNVHIPQRNIAKRMRDGRHSSALFPLMIFFLLLILLKETCVGWFSVDFCL